MIDKLSKFISVWEVETHFRCPVIGAILSVEKHKQLLEKCGYNIRGMKPYEYHQCLMSKLHERNNVSIKVDNFIRNQARKYMLAIHGKPEKEIRRLWEEQSRIGNAGPLMYAIVSYKDASIELLHDIYGEVHMLAHANMTQIHDIRKKLTAADENLQREKNRSDQKNNEIKKLTRNKKVLLEKVLVLEQENLRLQKNTCKFQSDISLSLNPEETNKQLNQTLEQLYHRLMEKDEKIRIVEREKRSLQVEFFSLKKEKEMFETQMQELINGFDALKFPDSGCPAGNCQDGNCTKEKCAQYQLCAKRIFMVGGMTKMKSFYRDIVEKAGGEFDYHDGYLKSTAANLEAKVRRSDMVICPVDCNSHNACLRVKKLCHQYNKQLKIISSSSLSAITNALFKQEHETVLN